MVPVVPTSPVSTVMVESVPFARRVTVERSPTVVMALLGAISTFSALPVVMVKLAVCPILIDSSSRSA